MGTQEEAVRTVYKEALELYVEAEQVCRFEDWQPKWLRALLLIKMRRMEEAAALLYKDVLVHFSSLLEFFQSGSSFRLEYYEPLRQHMADSRGSVVTTTPLGTSAQPHPAAASLHGEL